jgi:RNA polymerase sigma factor (sigma-70 family)
MYEQDAWQNANEQQSWSIERVLSLLLENEPEDRNSESVKNLWIVFDRLQSQRLIRLAGEMGLSHEQIEDLIQEVYLKILVRWEEFRQPDGTRKLLALSCKMMHDDAVNLIRHLNVSRATLLDTELTEPIAPNASEFADKVAAKELCEWLEVGLEKLEAEHPKHAWLLRERFLKGRPLEELADEQGATAHALQCLKTRALHELHHLLSKHHPKREVAS